MRCPLFVALLIAVLPLSAAPAPVAERERFQKSIADAVKSSGLDAGVAIKDLVSGDEFFVQPDAAFPQGSTIRIHLVAELFRQAAAGKLSLDEPRALPDSARAGGSGVLRHMGTGSVSMSLRDYAVLMIAVNDHSAANFLTDVVGLENISASLQAQGTPEIKFRRRVMSRRDYPGGPENEATPRAVMRALELLHRGAVVDRATSDAIIEVLAVPEVSYFSRQLPYGVRFAGRSGSGPTMRCDAGIVLASERPFVICVMVKGLPFTPSRDYSKPDALITGITQLAVRHFIPGAMSPKLRGHTNTPEGHYTTTSSSSSNASEFMFVKSSSVSAEAIRTEDSAENFAKGS